MTTGVKRSSSSLPNSKDREEEAVRKTKVETARRLEKAARNLLAKEAQREKEEEEAARKKKEAILENITELEKEIAQETHNASQEIQDQEKNT